jgi:hypothetical protein
MTAPSGANSIPATDIREATGIAWISVFTLKESPATPYRVV